MNNSNKKYYIVTNKDIAITMETLLGRRPYTYPNKFVEGEFVYSFVNDAKFKRIFDLVMNLIEENER